MLAAQDGLRFPRMLGFANRPTALPRQLPFPSARACRNTHNPTAAQSRLNLE